MGKGFAVVAVEVRKNDRIDALRFDAGPPHREERRRPAVDERSTAVVLEERAGLQQQQWRKGGFDQPGASNHAGIDPECRRSIQDVYRPAIEAFPEQCPIGRRGVRTFQDQRLAGIEQSGEQRRIRHAGRDVIVNDRIDACSA
jgi:hypothetical protein